MISLKKQRQRHLPVLLLLLCSALLPTVAAISCYSHNKVEASSSEFYNATSDGKLIGCGNNTTTCCLEGQYCDVDLLCHDRNTGGVSRQYCSDPDWPEDSCSAVCPEYEAAGIALTACDKSGTKFCCGPSKDCCSNGKYTQINKNNGRVVAIGTSTIPTSSSTATSSSSSSSSTGGATRTTGATGATATDPSAANSGGDNGGGLTEQTKLGIGLGVGLGFPFLAAIIAALVLWRRSLSQQAKIAGGGGAGGSSDEMAKVASPVPGPGPAPGSAHSPGFGQDAAGFGAGAGSSAAGAAATERVPGSGRTVELGDNPPNKPVYQLDAQGNTRAELPDDTRVYELQ